MCKVSIIIPVYNVGAYLVNCLDSVLAQTFGDFEALCINDGATDASPAILAQYAAKDARVKVISQVNKGLSGARNTGLNHVSGEYILFLDSDDALPPFALDFFVRMAEESKADVVLSDKMFDVWPFFKVLPSLDYKLYHQGFKDLIRLPRSQSSACNKLYRAESLKGLRFIEGILFEDWPFVSVYFNRIKSFAVTTVPLYYYNKGGASIIRSSFSQRKVDSYVQGVRYVYDFYKDKPLLPFARKRLTTALKMCINACNRDKVNRASLAPYLVAQLDQLCADGIFNPRALPLKTQWRLFRLRRCVR